MNGYARFAGKRLAVVESLPHEAFQEAILAAREFGCEIWLLVQAEDWYTGGRPFSEPPLGQADKVLRVDTHDWTTIVDTLTDAQGRPLVDGVTSFSDRHTEATALAASHLALPSQGPEAVRTANHTHLPRRVPDGEPAGVAVGVESITVAGETHFYGVTSKQLHQDTLLEEAHSFPLFLDSIMWAEVKDCVDRALRGIGYRQGPAHTEVLISESGPRIVGITPRPAAHMVSTMVADVCGTDPYLDAKLLALGLTPSPGLPGDGARQACATVALFPDEPGRFIGIGGLREAVAHGVEIKMHAELGDHVGGRLDDSASVGFVFAHADAADQALATARVAASVIGVTTIRSPSAPPTGRPSPCPTYDD
ncbi:hypothetical protein [Streptomyces sp. NPDC054866]